MEMGETDTWALPPQLKSDRSAANPVEIYFKVWWTSLVLSFIGWVIVVRIWASEDTFWDVLSFAATIASIVGIAYSVLLVMFGLPVFILAYFKPNSLLWKSWCLLLISILISFLSVELLGYLIMQESVFRVEWVSPLIALGYGLITWLTLVVRKPKLLGGEKSSL